MSELPAPSEREVKLYFYPRNYRVRALRNEIYEVTRVDFTYSFEDDNMESPQPHTSLSFYGVRIKADGTRDKRSATGLIPGVDIEVRILWDNHGIACAKAAS